jgi:hypothetical protein
MIDTVGHLLLEVAGAVLALLAWTAAVVSWRHRHLAAAPEHRVAARPSRPDVYADLDDVIDSLDDLARDLRWDLAKRFAIARLACENRTVTIAALEQRYHRELGAVSDAPTADDCCGPSIH